MLVEREIKKFLKKNKQCVSSLNITHAKIGDRQILSIEIAKGSRTVIKNSFNLFNKHIKFSTVDLFETHVIFLIFILFFLYLIKKKTKKTI